MKQFYYFSTNRLKFEKIKEFYKRFFFLTIFFSIISTYLLFSIYFLIDEFINPNYKIKNLENENRELNELYSSLLERYSEAKNSIEVLDEKNEKFLIETNLNNFSNSSIGKIKTKENIKDADELMVKLYSFENQLVQVNNLFGNATNYFDQVEKLLNLNPSLFKSLPAIKPCSGIISTKFGKAKHPVLGIDVNHNGISITTKEGTPVLASGDGKIVFKGKKLNEGLTLEINHGFGFVSQYSYLKEIIVSQNQFVHRGDTVAYSGNPQNFSSGPHLYYEVRHKNIPLNPEFFMYSDLAIFEKKENF